MIPEAAVEAAAKAYNDLTGNLFESDYVRENMRTVIEAAAPFMLAGAKADAYDEGFEVAGDRFPAFNPYRTTK